MTQTFVLEAGGHHRLLIERGERWQVALESDPEHRFSELRHGLLRHLEISGVRLDDRGRAMVASDTLRVDIGGDLLLDLGTLEHRPLSPFESRYLADNLTPIRRTFTAAGTSVITDLHTHFAGCVRAEDLYRIGEDLDVVYPSRTLAEMGIDAGDVRLSEAPDPARSRIVGTLGIPFDRQATYREMQTIYERRRPITKRPEAFLPMCRRIAADYRDMGARYVELSLHQVVEQNVLATVLEHVPAIEAECGVTIRFLAAFGRHDDREWILDYLDRVRSVAGCRYVAGVDVMGHETNSTHAFSDLLHAFGEAIQRERPGFVIRVHAGENAAHPENVRAAAECVRGLDVTLRIGHGLYGCDDRAMDLLREANAIVEFNLDSNFALNNVQTFDPSRVPILRYSSSGVPVVLGTDGYGIYQTTLAEEVRAALSAGLTERDIASIRSTEEAYVGRRAELESRLSSFVIPSAPAPGRWTPAVTAAKQSAAAEAERTLMARFQAIGAKVIPLSEARRILRKQDVVSFAGAWRKSYDRVSKADRGRVEEVLEGLLEAWDPRKVVLLTGGTKYGIEGVVQRAARRRGFTVVGAVVRSLSADDLEEGAIDYACVVGDTIYDKADGLYRLVKDHGGTCFFIGGGAVVSDEIQTADNLGLPHLLMIGPEGASTEHARQQPERGFASVEEALEKMSAQRGPRGVLRHVGPNPAVDTVILRRLERGREVLLIRRRDDAKAASGAWALPGGFVASGAKPHALWIGGAETLREAAVREIREETGLDLLHLVESFAFVGEYEGGGRDPRDTPERWVRSTAFVVELDPETGRSPVTGTSDAQEARWWPIAALPTLAFDHATIVTASLG